MNKTKRIIALLLVLVLSLGLFAACDTSRDDEETETTSSYKDALDLILDVSYGGKVSKLKDLAPKAYWDYMEDEYGVTFEEVKEEYEGNWELNIESYEAYLGKNFKWSYTVDSKEKYDKDDLVYLKEELYDYYNIAEKDVKEAYDLEVTTTLKGSENEMSSTEEFTAINISGKWYIYMDGFLMDEAFQ